MSALAICNHVERVSKSHLPAGDDTQWGLMRAEAGMNDMNPAAATNGNMLWRTVISHASAGLRTWLLDNWAAHATPMLCTNTCSQAPGDVATPTYPVGMRAPSDTNGVYRRWA